MSFLLTTLSTTHIKVVYLKNVQGENIKMKFHKRLTYILFLLFFAFIYSCIPELLPDCCPPQQFKTDLFAAFENESQTGPNGLAWDGKNLIMGSLNQIITARNIITDAYRENSMNSVLSDGTYDLGRFPGPQQLKMDICGITWEKECCGDGFLWIADSEKNRLVKLKPNRSFVKSFKSPLKNPSGITYDGKYLWVISSNSSKMVQIDPNFELIINIYDVPIKGTGLTWDCNNGYIWLIGLKNCRGGTVSGCYKATLLSFDIITRQYTHKYLLPDAITNPSSIVWTGKEFWIGDYTLNRIFKIPFIEKKFIAFAEF